MAEPFVAQITMFGFNFPPKGWAFCQGQLLPISQNTALFSLIGTFYGGDGKSTFALPNIEGRACVSQGQGPGLSAYVMGEEEGAETHTLIGGEMPQHNHGLMATTNNGTVLASSGNQLSKAFGGGKQGSFTGNYLSTNAPNAAMSQLAITTSGGSQPHNNMQPYLTLNFCIALQGVYPPRS
jgi:microcystin-dependent protein